MGKKIKVRCLLVSRDQICSGFFKTRNLCNICLLSYCLLMSVSLFKCRNLSRIKHSPCPVIRWPLTSMSCVLLIDSAFTYMEKEGTLRLLCNLDILQIHNHHHHHQRKKKDLQPCLCFFRTFSHRPAVLMRAAVCRARGHAPPLQNVLKGEPLCCCSGCCSILSELDALQEAHTQTHMHTSKRSERCSL